MYDAGPALDQLQIAEDATNDAVSEFGSNTQDISALTGSFVNVVIEGVFIADIWALEPASRTL